MVEPQKTAAHSSRGMGGWLSWLQILTLALVYLGAAKIPMASSLTFQAYLFWPAAAVAYTAFFILGQRALWGIAVGSLLLNGTAWLPWPQALVMTLLQTAGPLVAWRIMVRLGSPHPDLRHTKDLLRWLGVATLSSALFSSAMGSIVVGSALPGGVFTHAFATSFSWFLGDLAAILCLGPMLLHVFPGLLEASRGTDSGHPNPSFFSMVLVGSLCLLLLFGGQISPGLSPDFRLSIQFALVLPVLWMALRFGPRYTSIGVSLLSLAFLLHLNTGRLPLSDEAFRFSQLHLLVLAFAALVTASVAEEARMAHLALEARELQALRMEAVGTLAGGLVHEFNNQLTVVFGNLDRLQTVLPDGGQASPVVQRLAEAVDSIGSTVKHLKALSHHAPLQMSPLSLREALVPFLLRVPELSGQVTFHLEIEDGLLVRLDPDLLSQALQHLLTNSLEAIPGRGHIQLKAWQQDAWIHLIFEDNGVGMSPEVLRKACDPFFTTKPTAKGRGLGLSFAFSLAKQMGGRLSLESQPGKGTRVELVFPLGRPAPHPAPTRERLSRAQRILLADDEAGIRELTREFLEGEGFQVLAVADGQEALDAFHSDPRAWDLLILDLVMPKLGGAEVLSRIEQIRPDLPALMISGYSAEVRPDLLDGSHRGFLAKPFRLHELLKAIQLLELKSPLRGAPLG